MSQFFARSASSGSEAAAALATAERTTTKSRNPWQLGWYRFKQNRTAIVGLVITLAFVVAAIFSPLIATHDPVKQSLSDAVQRPSREHFLGTDELGRDIFSRIVEGARISLSLSALSVSIGLLSGLVIGVVSGFYGRWVDMVLMRIIDVMLAIPGLLLAITIVAVIGVGLTSIIFAIAFSSIPTFARLARGRTLAVRSEEFILAATAIGSSNRRLMIKHVVPNIIPPLIVQTTLQLAAAILTASGLSFLGLGAQPPTPEWGSMLSTGRAYLTSSPHVAVFPGIAIMLVVFGFNLLGDGLLFALDPRSGRRA